LSGEDSNRLHALLVFQDFAFLTTEGYVPICRAWHNHLMNHEEKHELSKREIVSCPSGYDYWSPNLVFEGFFVQPVTSADQTDNLRCGRAVVDRRGKDDAFSFKHLGENGVKVVFDVAFSRFDAAFAAVAWRDLLSGEAD